VAQSDVPLWLFFRIHLIESSLCLLLVGVIIARPAVASLTATILRQHARDVGVAYGGDSFANGMGAQLAAPIDVDAPVDPPVEVDAPVEVKVPENMGPVPDKVVKWKGKSSMPKSVQILLAGAWLSILGLLPVVYAIIDHKAMTKTQMIVGAVMMVTVFGGFWLFTNIIYFQSPHFEKSRPLTLVECIYVMAQIITTVGYGDVTPAKPRGQIFVGLYVLGALFVIAMIISDLTDHVINAARAYREKGKQKVWQAGTARDPEGARTAEEAVALLLVLDRSWW